MQPLPRETLRQLLANFGPTLLSDPIRLDALLADLWGSYHPERFLLVHAAKLFAHSKGKVVHVQQFSQRLQRQFGFSVEAADWSTETWFALLDVATQEPGRFRVSSGSRDQIHAEYTDSFQNILPHLIVSHGPSLIEDSARLEAFLADYCAPFSRERFLLIQTLRECFPGEFLIRTHSDTDYLQKLSQRLQSRFGFGPEAARWAIECWTTTLVSALSGHDPILEEELALAEADVRKKEEEWNLAEIAAQKKEQGKDESVKFARLQQRESNVAQDLVRLKANEKRVAEETVRKRIKREVAALETLGGEEVARIKAEEVKKAILRILEYDPLTSNEVARILEVGQKAATTWLKQLQKAAKIEDTVLKRSGGFVTGYQVIDHPYTPVRGTRKDRQRAGRNGRLRVKEWKRAIQTSKKRESEKQAARAAKRERITAETEARRKEKEWKEAVTTARKREMEYLTAEAAIPEKEKEWREAVATARRREKEHLTARVGLRLKEGESDAAVKTASSRKQDWSEMEAVARQAIDERKKAEDEALQKARESKIIILQNVSQNPLTSRELTSLLKTEQEETIGLLRRLLDEDEIEPIWLERCPYSFCYQPKRRSKGLLGPRPGPHQKRPERGETKRSTKGCLGLLCLTAFLWLFTILKSTGLYPI